MKKIKALRNTTDLKLLKQQLRYEARIQEEVIGNGLTKFGKSFYDSLKNSVRRYTEKIAILALVGLIRSRFK